MLTGLVWFTLGSHDEIRQGNEKVRQWGRITDHLHTAIGAAERMHNIAKKLHKANDDETDELNFSYLEQSRIFSDSLLYPEILEIMSATTLKFVKKHEQAVAYQEELNPAHILSAFEALIPELENLYSTLWSQKRTAYIDYYENFQVSGSKLTTVSLSVLIFCVIVGIILSFWSISVTRKRLFALTSTAHDVCSGKLKIMDKPVTNRDELDELNSCLSDMTNQLINVVSVDKVLEGADSERKRIAMDLHDQTLSQLTALARQLEQLSLPNEHNAEVFNNIAEIENGIRQIIDDLHPRTLDILGLEPAIRSFLEKHTKQDNSPSYYLSIEAEVEDALTDGQCLSLYRIILEASHNILRHADCSQFEIILRVLHEDIVLTIDDNGKGLNITHDSNGLGMISITERAKSIGASVEWKSSRFNQGTRFQLCLPLPKNINDQIP